MMLGKSSWMIESPHFWVGSGLLGSSHRGTVKEPSYLLMSFVKEMIRSVRTSVSSDPLLTCFRITPRISRSSPKCSTSTWASDDRSPKKLGAWRWCQTDPSAMPTPVKLLSKALKTSFMMPQGAPGSTIPAGSAQ